MRSKFDGDLTWYILVVVDEAKLISPILVHKVLSEIFNPPGANTRAQQCLPMKAFAWSYSKKMVCYQIYI